MRGGAPAARAASIQSLGSASGTTTERFPAAPHAGRSRAEQVVPHACDEGPVVPQPVRKQGDRPSDPAATDEEVRYARTTGAGGLPGERPSASRMRASTASRASNHDLPPPARPSRRRVPRRYVPPTSSGTSAGAGAGRSRTDVHNEPGKGRRAMRPSRGHDSPDARGGRRRTEAAPRTTSPPRRPAWLLPRRSGATGARRRCWPPRAGAPGWWGCRSSPGRRRSTPRTARTRTAATRWGRGGPGVRAVPVASSGDRIAPIGPG